MLGRLLSATLFCGAFLVLTVEDASSASKTISKPMFNGNRLDWCLKWSTYCGKPAADAYCRSQGFQEAVDFAPDPRIGAHTPTRLIGSGAICDLKSCDGFAQITCEKTPIAPAAASRRIETSQNADLVQKASLVAPLPQAKPPALTANAAPPASPGVPPIMRKGDAYRVASASQDGFDASEPKKEPMKLASAPKVEPVRPTSKPAAPEVKEAKEAKAAEPVESKAADGAKTDAATTASVTPTPVWVPAPKMFDKPMYNGKRLDWCRGWDKDCGQAAADAFCKTNGYSKATAFNQDPHIGDAEPTRVIANGAVCDQALCNGFKDITCTM